MRYQLSLDQIPTAWFNVLPVMPEPLQPPLHPGTKRAGRSRRPRAAVPDGPHRAGGVGRAVDRRARRGARHPAPVAADAARARRAARARARHAGAHLLQGRVGVARGFAQAEHRGAAGVLQPGRGHRAAHDRDRRRPVGHRAVVRVRAVRPRVQGLHGAGVVRAEAVPQDPHGDVGRARSCRHRSTTPTTRARSASRSATRCATPRRATTRTTRSARCSTTCCCTRPSSGSRRRSSSRSRARRGPTS